MISGKILKIDGQGRGTQVVPFQLIPKRHRGGWYDDVAPRIWNSTDLAHLGANQIKIGAQFL